MMMMVMVRRRAVCAVLFLALLCCCCSSVCVTAAGSPGHVSGDAGTVVVPVDVSCAQSDGSLSYRVHGGVWAWKKCSVAGAEAQHENYTFSGFDVRMHSRNGEMGAVCHVANAVYTCNNCAASCATKGEGVTVAFTMNVTTHKYAGLYFLWKNQFSPDGTIPAPARSSDADRTGICHPPPPREGKDERKSGEATASQVSAEPSRQNEDARQSAVADAPRTVDQSPASNTETNTSMKKPRIATDPNENVAPTPSNRKPSIAMSRNIKMDPNASVTKTAPATALRKAVGSRDARKSEADDGSGEHVPGKIAGGMNGQNVPGTPKRHQEMCPCAIWSGVSPDGRLVLFDDVELIPRDSTGGRTARVCVSLTLLLLLLELCGVVVVFRAKEGGIVTPHGEHVPRCMRFFVTVSSLLF
ncbi:hypothetical protein TcCL_NonESM04866 [Trypanosoma cruzi]|uniref:Mucin-like glycoprotein n=1 Tax=Trypanosoma cruzi (strain CL Brener) TaxID=353153 RepID=Q4DGK4_TRYCC|nr:hypothetical protein Tc00.1047053511257.80 [Trypanosoma cruzi]EAN91659.1 hypothetical protein Tc00.1047053511257.80 [Trypanosoma cruzi]RNC45351.1 hypothetical protein TcCL_NonESM04866 [Trypanosoma cruzi]|eukprot:XP_813510.1 hypothetical protein [Trypanosoma cruzi strain CL Brener]